MNTDPELSELANNLVHMNNEAGKEELFDEFMEKSPEKNFYRISLNKSGEKCDIRLVNMSMIILKRSLILTNIVTDGNDEYLIGGIGFLDENLIRRVDRKMFDVKLLDFKTDNNLRELVESLSNK